MSLENEAKRLQSGDKLIALRDQYVNRRASIVSIKNQLLSMRDNFQTNSPAVYTQADVDEVNALIDALRADLQTLASSF